MAENADQTAERLAAIQRDARSLAGHVDEPETASTVPSPETVQLLRIISNITLGSFVLLVLTGVHLFFFYRPLSNLTQRDELAGGTSGVGGLFELSRQLHWLSGWLVTGGITVGLIAWVVPRRRIAVLGTVPMLLLLLGAAVVGRRGAWDGVRVGASAIDLPTGFPALFRDEVLEIVRGGSSVTAAQLLGWVVAHIALGVLAAGVAALTVARTRRRT